MLMSDDSFSIPISSLLRFFHPNNRCLSVKFNLVTVNSIGPLLLKHFSPTRSPQWVCSKVVESRFQKPPASPAHRLLAAFSWTFPPPHSAPGPLGLSALRSSFSYSPPLFLLAPLNIFGTFSMLSFWCELAISASTILCSALF